MELRLSAHDPRVLAERRPGIRDPEDGGPATLEPATMRSLAFDRIGASAAVLDGRGLIVDANAPWRLFAHLNGATLSSAGVGVSYLDVCDRSAADGCAVAALVAAELRALLAGERDRFDLEYTCPSPIEDRWFRLEASTAPVGSDTGAIVFHRDITTDRVRAAPGEAPGRDGLTGLADRSTALRWIEDRLGAGIPVAVVLFDLEDIAAVDDRFGHGVGDDVVVRAALRMERQAPSGSLVARVGEGRFALVATGRWDLAGARRAAEAIRAALVRPIQTGAEVVSIVVGVGIAISGEDATGDRLVGTAEEQVDRDKQHRVRPRRRLADLVDGTGRKPVRIDPPGEAAPHEALVAELRASRARTEAVLAHSSDLVMFFHGDGTIDWVSQSVEKLFGVDPGALVGTNGFEMIHPDDQERVLADFLSIPGLGDSVTSEFRITLGPEVRWVEEIATNLLEEPSVRRIVGNLRDVTERREAQDALLLQGTLLAAAGQAIVARDAEGRILYWNQAAEALYGWSTDEAVGRHLGDLLRFAEGSEVPAAAAEVTVRGEPWDGEVTVIHRSGREVPIMVTSRPVFNASDELVATTVVSSDITARHAAEVALAHQANHDPLTGLANRRLLVEALEASIARSASTGRHTGVAFVDLDDFKTINDRYGHVDGDEVLCAVAALFEGVSDDRDTVARLGGDEYVVCCDDVADAQELLARVARLHDCLRHPFRVRERLHSLAASIGLAISTPGMPAEALMRNADAAMYAAKQAGGSRSELFDDALYVEERRRQELAAEVASGLDDGQFQTHFQPEIELSTGVLVGFEALVRWVHPVRGPIPPTEFIEIAEATGTIGRLGRQVLAEGCRALASWREAPTGRDLSVAINVSPVQLADPDFPGDVRHAIAMAGVPPERVCLEVTESSLMDPDVAAATLRDLKAVGVTIAIDDFGTGYSSLSRLRRFPVDLIKIDRSFVSGLPSSPDDDAIVTAVINLASSLGIEAIAEGVETREQLDVLVGHGCRLGQGYLWSPALPPAEAAAFAARAASRPGGAPGAS